MDDLWVVEIILLHQFSVVHCKEYLHIYILVSIASVFATDYVIVRVLLTLSFFFTPHIMIFLTVVQ